MPLGIFRRRQGAAEKDRIPPDQSVTKGWPVLHEGAVPEFDPDTWDFRIFGLVEEPITLSYEQFMSLPKVKVTSDIHCVTGWSKLDNTWEGIATTGDSQTRPPSSRSQARHGARGKRVHRQRPPRGFSRR